MDLCPAAERKPRMSLSKKLWEHYTLDIPKIRARHAAAKRAETMEPKKTDGEVE